MLNIAGSSRHIVRDLRARQPKLIKSATVTAMNRANSKVFTEAKREIRSETGIPLKHFKKKLKKYNAKRNKMRARVWMGLNNVIKLSAVNTGKKVQGKWTKYVTGSLEGQSISNAFRAKLPSGHQGIFVRKRSASSASGTDSKGRPRKGRLPIQEVVLQISDAAARAVKSAGDKHARKAFEKAFRHEVQRRQKNIGNR